jgi:hypothetical protein
MQIVRVAMPDVSRKIFILRPPADRPELQPHFAALASKDGWLLHYIAEDSETGETALVRVEFGDNGEGAAQ